MNIITTASYYGTGSSAITDLLGEYSGNISLGSDFECRIAHDMHGLSDLEYYLVENNHRHNSSVAVKEFLRLMDIYGLDRNIRFENYPEILKIDFKKAVNDYIKHISPLSYKGGSHLDIYRKSDSNLSWLKLKGKVYRFLNKSPHITADDTTWLKVKKSPLIKAREDEITYIVDPAIPFLDVTCQFTDSLLSYYLSQPGNNLIVDQLVPPTNTMRYVRYFNNLKVICVDRDPRDIYYNEKMYIRGGVIPIDDVDLFIAWYKSTRAHKSKENDDSSLVMRLNFEDIILNYDEVVPQIENFLGLSPENHVNKKQLLNPEISIKNIGKWEADNSERNNINKIEKELLGTEYYSYNNDRNNCKCYHPNL